MKNDSVTFQEVETLTFKLVNIEKSYGKTQVLKGLDLTIEEGEFVVVRGKSGVGKSSLRDRYHEYGVGISIR